MSEDLGKKIKQITDMLGQESMPDGIMELLTRLTSASGREDTPPAPAESPSVKEEKRDRAPMDETFEMVRTIKKVMDRVNTPNDPRINLLNAIKPFLNNKRQSKISNCVRLLQMTNLTSLLDEHNKDNP